MKKLLLLFSICFLSVTAAFSQDDTYYDGGDQSTVTDKSQTPPPAMPTYVQPACPYDGYMWTPGYWAWGPMGYYWVPGVWVSPPQPGLLWTPGYWGWAGGWYGWHGGYWGNNIGYYGGVNYGYGYGGSGYYGGRWVGNSFQYNTAVVSVNTAVVHNTYQANAPVSNSVASNASYNGPGGVQAHPTPAEQANMGQPHVQPTAVQQSHQVAASNDKNQLASVNNGKPATTAMAAPNGQKFGAEGHAASSNTAGTSHQASGTVNNKPVSESSGKTAQSAHTTNGNANAQQPHNNNNNHPQQKTANKASAKPAHSAPPAQHSSSGKK